MSAIRIYERQSSSIPGAPTERSVRPAEEEMDFIINYDIKYRLGLGEGEEEE